MDKTFAFLKALNSNNNKEWFDAHKDQYLEARAEFEELVGKVIEGINKFDKEVSLSLKPKDCIFRIYRDVRFSKDKTPYKTHFSADINPGGRKSQSAGYYFQLSPGHSGIAGGVYTPEPNVLAAVRQEIDYNGKELEKILKSKSYSRYFNGLEEDDKLKTVPKGYDKDHPHIELLKLKNFIAWHEMPDKIAKSKDVHKEILNGFKAMHPLLKFLRAAVE